MDTLLAVLNDFWLMYVGYVVHRYVLLRLLDSFDEAVQSAARYITQGLHQQLPSSLPTLDRSPVQIEQLQIGQSLNLLPIEILSDMSVEPPPYHAATQHPIPLLSSVTGPLNQMPIVQPPAGVVEVGPQSDSLPHDGPSFEVFMRELYGEARAREINAWLPYFALGMILLILLDDLYRAYGGPYTAAARRFFCRPFFVSVGRQWDRVCTLLTYNDGRESSNLAAAAQYALEENSIHDIFMSVESGYRDGDIITRAIMNMPYGADQIPPPSCTLRRYASALRRYASSLLRCVWRCVSALLPYVSPLWGYTVLFWLCVHCLLNQAESIVCFYASRCVVFVCNLVVFRMPAMLYRNRDPDGAAVVPENPDMRPSLESFDDSHSEPEERVDSQEYAAVNDAQHDFMTNSHVQGAEYSHDTTDEHTPHYSAAQSASTTPVDDAPAIPLTRYTLYSIPEGNELEFASLDAVTEQGTIGYEQLSRDRPPPLSLSDGDRLSMIEANTNSNWSDSDRPFYGPRCQMEDEVPESMRASGSGDITKGLTAKGKGKGKAE